MPAPPRRGDAPAAPNDGAASKDGSTRAKAANDVGPERTAVDPTCGPPLDRQTAGPGTGTGCPPLSAAERAARRLLPVL